MISLRHLIGYKITARRDVELFSIHGGYIPEIKIEEIKVIA